MTTVGTVRQTYINCEKIKQMLYNLRINVFLKNVALDKRYLDELEERLQVLPIFCAEFGDFAVICFAEFGDFVVWGVGRGSGVWSWKLNIEN